MKTVDGSKVHELSIRVLLLPHRTSAYSHTGCPTSITLSSLQTVNSSRQKHDYENNSSTTTITLVQSALTAKSYLNQCHLLNYMMYNGNGCLNKYTKKQRILISSLLKQGRHFWYLLTDCLRYGLRLSWLLLSSIQIACQMKKSDSSNSSSFTDLLIRKMKIHYRTRSQENHLKKYVWMHKRTHLFF